MNNYQDESEKRYTLRVPGELHQLFEEARRKQGQTSTSFFLEAGKMLASHILDGGEVSSVDGGPSALLLDLDAFSGHANLINIDAIECEVSKDSRLVQKIFFYTTENDAINGSVKLLIERGWEPKPRPTREWTKTEVAMAALGIAKEGSSDRLFLVTDDIELGRIVQQQPIRSRKMKVIGILLSDEFATSADFTREFDDFRFYDKLDQPLVSDALREHRERYARSLAHETYKIQKMGRKAVGAQLKPFMERRHPEFYPGLIGFTKLKELALFAVESDLVTMKESGLDFELRTTEKGDNVATQLDKDESTNDAHDAEVRAINSSIQELIHIELPPHDTRQLVFSTLAGILAEHSSSNGIGLIALTYFIEERLARAKIRQNTIYRLLRGLYGVGAFRFKHNPENHNDPIIDELKLGADQLDNAYVLNMVSQCRLHTLGSPESMARAFYGSTDQHPKMLAFAQAAKVDFDREEIPNILEKLKKQ